MSQKAHVLVVENDKSTCHGLVTQLREAGYEATPALDVQTAIDSIKTVRPDAILMELSMASENELLQQFRTDADTATSAPIVVLIPRGAEAEATTALETGADDFLTKPARAPELIARLQVAMRRTRREEPSRAVALRAGPIFLHANRREAYVRLANGEIRPLRLTKREFALLRALMARKNQMMSRRQIVDEAFGDSAPIDPANLGAYIHRLREKVEPDPANPRHIVTDRGLGFKIVD
jgi:two-component system response regulator RegX3